MNLTADDHRRIEAAHGWLELGNHAEASNELQNLTVARRGHPDVLKLRWRISNAAGQHDNAFEIADELTELLPDDPEPFIWRSHSARQMKGGGAGLALELLLEAVNDFEDEPILPFRVACYQCQVGNIDEAQAWLERAFELAERNGTAQHWKTLALDEPDLGRLRKEESGP